MAEWLALRYGSYLFEDKTPVIKLGGKRKGRVHLEESDNFPSRKLNIL